MSEEKTNAASSAGIPGWGGFEFGRRLGLQAAATIAAGGAFASLVDVSTAAAASKSKTIKIGFVSPRTGALSDFAGPDKFVLSQVRAASQFAKGIKIGGTTYKIEITEVDTQSDPNVAVQVTQGLINGGADLIVTSSAPETTIPVSITCEAAHVPCLSTVVPWEAYWGGFTGTSITPEGGAAGTGPKYNATFFFGIPQFSGCFVPMWERVQKATGANGYVAEMFPNDADGNAFRAAFGPTVGAMFPNKYTFVDGGAYADLTTSYTTMIETFKTGGPNGGPCDLFVNCPLPPDFQTFWTQASQQDYNPKLATVAKVMLFPTDAYALGELSNNIATDAWFTPYSPYESSLTGLKANAFCAAFQVATKGQWVQSMGSTYSLFEVAIEALKKIKNPHNRLDLAEALQHVKYDGMCGPINMRSTSSNPLAASPAPGIAIIQPVGIQWKPGSTELVGHKKFSWSPWIVDNSLNKSIPTNATLDPTNA
jgi:branched-chain amino acid transport system substrate-binding protein